MPTPTDFEQEMLELLNRARTNPAGEFDALILDADTQTGASNSITNALRYFDVDMDVLESQLSGLSPVAALAWNDALSQASRDHSQRMIDTDTQSHQLPGEASLRGRIEDAGYTSWRGIAENVFAYTQDPLQGHAGFYVDWGNTPTGIQTPAGHRNNIMSSTYTEVGIAALAENDSSTRVGPFVVTQNFGTRSTYNPQLLGVVFDDDDEDDFYDAGEGLGGITVMLSGGGENFTTTTWTSGGYQIALQPGTYTVTFSGGALTQDVSNQIVMGTQNLKHDINADDLPALPVVVEDQVLTGNRGDNILTGARGADTLRGEAGNDRLDGGAGADYLNGGQGSDVYIVDNTGDQIIESRKWGGIDHVYSSIDFKAGRAHIEEITLTSNDDIRAIGNGLANTIRGNGGDNILDGKKQIDTMIGGDGDDLYVVSAPNEVLIENANEGIDTVRAYRSWALADNIENLELRSRFDFNGIGNDLDNVITGNSGNNMLIGRGGNDTLRGLAGEDTFVFDRAASADNADTISDFTTGEDIIKIKGSLFGGLGIGVLDARAFTQGQEARDAHDRLVYDDASGRLWIDTDGAGGADQVLLMVIDNTAALTHEDFLIY